MSFIINYQSKHLMIHFSDIVSSATVFITNDRGNHIVDAVRINNNDFINIKVGLNPGSYLVKIVTEEKEMSKSIIVK